MNKIARIAAAGSMLLALSTSVAAHHSAAAYDTQKEVTLNGSVVKYRFANPHVYMTLQVKKDDGTTSTVEVEAGAASVLNGLGFTSTSLKVGELVTVTGNPGRNNPDAMILGKDLYKKDGTYLPLNIASRSVYDGKIDVKASSIAGTWFSPMRGFTGF